MNVEVKYVIVVDLLVDKVVIGISYVILVEMDYEVLVLLEIWDLFCVVFVMYILGIIGKLKGVV